MTYHNCYLIANNHKNNDKNVQNYCNSLQLSSSTVTKSSEQNQVKVNSNNMRDSSEGVW